MLLIMIYVIFTNSFIYPLDFIETEEQKVMLIQFIEKNVKETYCAIGMCNYSIILMMYKEEQKALNKSLK